MSSHNSETDYLESTKNKGDEYSGRKRRNSLYHWLALGSIGASVALFAAGKKSAAIFVGLWPPTFEALRSNR
jgi:hypothetical protein